MCLPVILSINIQVFGVVPLFVFSSFSLLFVRYVGCCFYFFISLLLPFVLSVFRSCLVSWCCSAFRTQCVWHCNAKYTYLASQCQEL